MAPQIHEYLPEQDQAQPVGGISPNIEQVSAVGRGIERFGGEITSSADFLEQRASQMEVSDAAANVSDQKAQMLQQIKEGTQNGTLDTDKIHQQYDDWVSQQSENYDTPGGKNTFNRLAARTRASLMMAGVQGNTQIAGAKAKMDFQTTMNNQESMVEANPLLFESSRGDVTEAIQGLIDAGGVPPQQQATLTQEAYTRLSQAAIRGHASQDFQNISQDMIASNGKINITDPKYNTAKHMLDAGAFADGDGNEYLNTQQKKEMYKELRDNIGAAQTEGNRVLQYQKQQKLQNDDDFLDKSLPAIMGNQLAVKDVLNSNASPQMKEHIFEKMHQQQERGNQSDPAAFNNIMDKIYQGQIQDTSQLAPLVGKNISNNDYMTLRKAIDNSPQGAINRQYESTLMQNAKTALKPIAGSMDPNAEQKFALFQSDYQNAKQLAIRNNEPLQKILDPASPDYFGNKMAAYKNTPLKSLQDQAAMVKGFIQIPQVMPGTPIKPTTLEAQVTSQVAPAVTKPVANKINPPPGLTLEQFKTWKREHGG